MNIITVLVFLYRSPVLLRQAMLASSCSQLEAIGNSTSQQQSSITEMQGQPCSPSRQGAAPVSSAPLISPPSAACEAIAGQGNGPQLLGQLLYLRRRAGKSEKDGEALRHDSDGLLRLVRSHSEPGFGSSTDTGQQETDKSPSMSALMHLS